MAGNVTPNAERLADHQPQDDAAAAAEERGERNALEERPALAKANSGRIA
jgi:hypothetical protein